MMTCDCACGMMPMRNKLKTELIHWQLMRLDRGHDQRVTVRFQEELEDAKGPPDELNC
jgi:hypothetical protein